MMLANLIRLGEIADNYSHGRRVSIELTLSGEGMLVTGTLFDEFGIVATHRYKQMVQWGQAFRNDKAVGRALEDVHAKVQQQWRKQG